VKKNETRLYLPKLGIVEINATMYISRQTPDFKISSAV